MKSIQAPVPFVPPQLSDMIHDAKASIQRLRSRFHVLRSTIATPELMAPYPLLDGERYERTVSDLADLLDALNSFQQLAVPLQDQLDELTRRVSAAKERIARLEE